jgi:hypothetical protein
MLHLDDTLFGLLLSLGVAFLFGSAIVAALLRGYR